MRESRSTLNSSTATWLASWRAAARAWPTRSLNSERFGSCVSTSWLDRKSSWWWAAFSADRSVDTDT